jgi:simple sugar transport system substrate-binding protein
MTRQRPSGGEVTQTSDKINVYSADVSTAGIQETRELGSSWVATSATNPAIVGEVSLRALVLLIAGQDLGKVIEVKPVPITREALKKSDIKTVQDLEKKLPGFGVCDLATAEWLAAPAQSVLR